MNIIDFVSSFSNSPSTTEYTPKVIRCKINAWLTKQKFQPLALTSKNCEQLRTFFNKICTKKNKVSNLVNYTARLTLFPTPQDGLESLSILLRKEKGNLQDYKQLHDTAKILLYWVEDYLTNRSLGWLQDRIIELWHSNKFVPPGTSVNDSFLLHYKDMIESVLKPLSFVFVYHLYDHIAKNKQNRNIQDICKLTDDELHTILTSKKQIADPALEPVTQEIFNLFEVASLMDHFDETNANIRSSQAFINHTPLLRSLFPLGPEYHALISSPKIFSTEDPLDGTRAFAENSAFYADRKECLLKIYLQILTKMSEIKNESPLRDRPNFEVLYPEPEASLKIFEKKIELCINFQFTSAFSRQLERIGLIVDNEEIIPQEPPAPEPPPERAALQIDPRVLRWFDPSNDPFANDPQYIKTPAKKQPEIRFIHNFAKITDDISMEVGRSFLRANKNGVEERMISMAIQADTPFSKKTETYVSTLTFGTDNVLYHRTLTKKSQGALIDEMTAEGVYERDFPPLESMKKSVAIPQDLLNKVADDGSYILSLDGKVITIADPKWPLADGSPTLIYLMII